MISEQSYKNLKQQFKTDSLKAYLHIMMRIFTVKILMENLKNSDNQIIFS